MKKFLLTSSLFVVALGLFAIFGDPLNAQQVRRTADGLEIQSGPNPGYFNGTFRFTPGSVANFTGATIIPGNTGNFSFGNNTWMNLTLASGNLGNSTMRVLAPNISLPGTGLAVAGGNSATVAYLSTSAGLAGNISDETGSGALVFGTGYTLGNGTITGNVNGTANYNGTISFIGATSIAAPTFTGLASGANATWSGNVTVGTSTPVTNATVTVNGNLSTGAGPAVSIVSANATAIRLYIEGVGLKYIIYTP